MGCCGGDDDSKRLEVGRSLLQCPARHAALPDVGAWPRAGSEHLPPLPVLPQGVAQTRKCRDVLFLLLFLGFWVGMFVVCGVAFKKGAERNPKRPLPAAPWALPAPRIGPPRAPELRGPPSPGAPAAVAGRRSAGMPPYGCRACPPQATPRG